MKILYIHDWMHHKNHNSLMNYKNINLHIIKDAKLINDKLIKLYYCLDVL